MGHRGRERERGGGGGGRRRRNKYNGLKDQSNAQSFVDKHMVSLDMYTCIYTCMCVRVCVCVCVCGQPGRETEEYTCNKENRIDLHQFCTAAEDMHLTLLL